MLRLGVGRLLLGVEELERALGRGDTRLEHVGHARDLADRLRELARVLDERGRVADCHLTGSHTEAADDGDQHVRQVGDEVHRGHDHARDELCADRRLPQLVVAGVELLEHDGVAAEGAHQVEAGVRLLDVPVERTGRAPLLLEQLLRAGADHAGDHAGERDRDQRDERELPRHDEHHDADADDRQHRLDQLREGLLQRRLDVVDVVGHARHQVTALARVEVAERQPVELRLDIGAQSVDHAHHERVQDVPLPPLEQRGRDVHREHDREQAAELDEVDAVARNQSVRRDRSDSALEDDVRGASEHLRRDHDERHRDDDEQGHERHAQPLGLQEAEEALERRPEVLRLLGRGSSEHVAVGLRRLVLVLELELFDRGLDSGFGEHALACFRRTARAALRRAVLRGAVLRRVVVLRAGHLRPPPGSAATRRSRDTSRSSPAVRRGCRVRRSVRRRAR